MRWAEAEVRRIGGFESQVLDLGEMVCARHLIPAGHLGDVLKDAELVEFTATGAYSRKAEHLAERAKQAK